MREMGRQRARYLCIGGERGGRYLAVAANQRGSVRGRLFWRACGALVLIGGVVILATCVGTWLWPLGWVATLWGATGAVEG